MKKNIIISTIKSWNIENAKSLQKKYKDIYNIQIITEKHELTFEKINKFNPKYIFFPHWSWLIPDEIFNNFDCIVFHMTDLPYGRGGSPLQNLILKKKYETKISAIKVVKELDAGDIYLKKNFFIGIGSADEILKKASHIIFNEMIPHIINNEIKPTQQKGEIINFKRRNPGQSDLNNTNINNLTDFYDFIRMLDGEGYPKAFLKIGNFKIEFSEICNKSDKLTGRFEIKYE